MTQTELNRAVAAATGESLGDIRARGFSLLGPLPPEREPVFAQRGRRRRGRRRGRRRARPLIPVETE